MKTCDQEMNARTICLNGTPAFGDGVVSLALGATLVRNSPATV